MLATYQWAWGLSLSMVYIAGERPLEKTNFSLVRGCQLEIASGLGTGAVPPSSLNT